MDDNIWFPSVVWSCDLDLDNDVLSSYVYEKIQQELTTPTLGKPKKSWESVSLVVEENAEAQKLVDNLNEKMYSICNEVDLVPVQLYDIWANMNPPGVSNVLHDHTGTTFSGVYYVQAEEGQGDLVFERHDGGERAMGPMQILKENPFNARTVTYKSRTGRLYIFPSWLKHRVDENKTDTARISISFNYGA